MHLVENNVWLKILLCCICDFNSLDDDVVVVSKALRSLCLMNSKEFLLLDSMH